MKQAEEQERILLLDRQAQEAAEMEKMKVVARQLEAEKERSSYLGTGCR